MIYYSDSLLGCDKSYYYLSSQSLDCSDTFCLRTLTFKELLSISKTSTLLTENINGTNVFFTSKIGEVNYDALSILKIRLKKREYRKLEILSNSFFSFDGDECEFKWYFINSAGKYEVVDVDSRFIRIYDWLNFVKHNECIDNPLMYSIDLIELEPTEIDSIVKVPN